MSQEQLKPWVVNLKKYGIWVMLILLIGGGYYLTKHSSKTVGVSTIVQSSQAEKVVEQTGKTVDTQIPVPDFDNPTSTGAPIVWQVMEWNSQFPLMFANGGKNTSKGSLFAGAGINCKILRQDDCNQTVKDFVANANQMAKDSSTPPLIVSFMFDGTPGYSTAMNEISKLKGNYRPIVFYFMGRSNCEDCFWGPASWKSHPRECLGHSVVGVERDGDMNIVLQWCSINNIPINVDTKYCDRDALNVIPASDFNVGTDNGGVVPKVLTGFTEKRILKHNGKTYPDTLIDVTCDSWTSWSPVDKTIADKKGGFTRLASTAEFTTQMPNACIINAHWAESHPDKMYAIIKSLGQAGDQVRSFTNAQEFAAKVSAKVYADQDANYWLKLYYGVIQNDKKGNPVQLGGSQSYNLADAANMFGLGKDGQDRAKITYDNFAGILSKLYPKEMQGYLPYEKMVDKQYIQYVLDHNSDLKNGHIESEDNKYASGNIETEQVGSKPYNIVFAKGKADILPASSSDLTKIYHDAMEAEKLTVFIYGHTDNSGSDAINQPLSEARAEAVKAYLHAKFNLPLDRMQTKGYGSSQPIDGTQASDASNRCVEIKLGN